MELEATKVIEKLKLIIASQAEQIAMLQVMIDNLQSKP